MKRGKSEPRAVRAWAVWSDQAGRVPFLYEIWEGKDMNIVRVEVQPVRREQ